MHGKPYIEHKDSAGRPDDIVAAEWWLGHLQRDQSIINIFTGQYKSNLTCNNCGQESARFETFSLLQVSALQQERLDCPNFFC